MAVSLTRRHRSPVALVNFDLDGLKRFNEAVGHVAGDQVLAAFATLLGDLCAAQDLLRRAHDALHAAQRGGADAVGSIE